MKNVKIPPDIHSDLRLISALTDKSIQELVSLAIRQYIDRHHGLKRVMDTAKN